MVLPFASLSSPSTPGFQRNLLIFDRCRLVSDAQVPFGPANILATRSASASAASTRAADFFPSSGQSTRAGGVIGRGLPRTRSEGGLCGATRGDGGRHANLRHRL